jgi:hypothetical protein
MITFFFMNFSYIYIYTTESVEYLIKNFGKTQNKWTETINERVVREDTVENSAEEVRGGGVSDGQLRIKIT